ncbi:MAG: OmpA family protein [Desulfobacterales bacterium]
MRHTVFGLALGIWFGLFSGLMPAGTFAANQISERTVLEGITFGQGSAILKKASLPSLEPLLKELQSDPNLRIVVEGHSAASGVADTDMKLSRNRALAVFNWLVAQGVDASRISYAGLGSAQPIVTAKTAGDRVKNDRIEITKTRDLFPEAVFPETQYQFEPVADGMEIQHDFVVKNTGTAELDIKEVKPG